MSKMKSVEFKHPYEMLQSNASAYCKKIALKGHCLGDRSTSDFFGLTWPEVLERVDAYALYFRSIGIKKGDRIGIQARNQMGWALADWAMLASGIVSVPIYVQSIEREISYICDEAQLKLLLCDEPCSGLSIRQLSLQNLDIQARPFLGQLFTCEPFAPQDVCTIIYTSGTTGIPKGVIHSLQNISTAVQVGVKYLGINSKDQLLSYLPLSHIAERMLCGFLPIYSGASVCFVESAEKLSRVLPLIKPTVFLAVPRVWEMMRTKLKRELESNPMLQARLEAIPSFIRSRVLGLMVKRKLGFSRTRFFFSGAAKLHADTANYLNQFGIRVAELYGLTETLGVSIFSNAKKPLFGSVGKPYPGVEVKFLEDGELCLKADFHFLGYFNKAEETAAVLRDGWFHTGDIGRQDENGNIFITDRKKDIFKTANGKYVAPLPIETLLRAHPAIRDVMVIGENRPHCVAIASVEESLANTEDLMRHLETVNAVLPIHEKIKTIGCVTRAWSIGEGELTPTLKLKRPQLMKRYSDSIEQLFEARRPVEFLDSGIERKISAHSRF